MKFQYEIEVDVEKPRYGYLVSSTPENVVFKKQDLRALGIWDVIFSHEVVPVIEGTKNWEADHEEKVKALKKLNIDTSKLEEEVVITDVEDPIRLVSRYSNHIFV